MQIITHRGLDPSRKNYYKESSLEAFTDQLERGYGLEFDIQITKNGNVVIIHDTNLARMTHGKDMREIRSIESSELLAMNFDGSHITTLENLLKLIHELQSPQAVSAMHLKHASQGKSDLDLILSYLKDADVSRFFIFDATIETARYLKSKHSGLRIAPSVAHPYDIERYNQVVGGTLMPIEEVLAHRDLFDGVWLDEWDLADKNGGVKKLYTKEIVDLFKQQGLWVGLVTPELHGTSPGLLGGESHPDAASFDSLIERCREIIACDPDALCTDYPDILKTMISH